MDKFYIVEMGQDRWTFLGNVPDCLRSGYGKPQTYHSKGDAELAAYSNGYPDIEVAAVSEYSF